MCFFYLLSVALYQFKTVHVKSKLKHLLCPNSRGVEHPTLNLVVKTSNPCNGILRERDREREMRMVSLGHYNNTNNDCTYNRNTFSPVIQLASFLFDFLRL